MTTFTKRIAATADDCFSNATGTYLTTDLAVGRLSSNSATGLRFTSVDVPQGAEITSAKLTFRAYGASTCNQQVTINGVDEDNFDGFTDASGDRPYSYPNQTTAAPTWQLTNWVNNTNYDSSDITDVVQEIVDRASWASGNAMGFVINATGASNNYVSAYDYTQSTSYCPLLTIEYTSAAGPANLKTYNTNAVANIKTINTNAIANVKSLNTNN